MENLNFFDLFCELTKLPYNDLSCEIVAHALAVAKIYEPEHYLTYVEQCDAWRYFNS